MARKVKGSEGREKELKRNETTTLARTIVHNHKNELAAIEGNSKQLVPPGRISVPRLTVVYGQPGHITSIKRK